MKYILYILKLARVTNVTITISVVFISAIISGYHDYNYLLTFLLVSAAFTTAAGNVINDYFDIEIDKINRPSRPLPSGKISKKSALYLYGILFIGSTFFSLQISTIAFLIVLTTNLLLFIYSYYLKRTPLVGNFIISICTSLAFIYGGVLTENFSATLLPAAFAFLITLIREILKDIEDIEGDKSSDQLTFPIKFGIDKSKNLLFIISILLILVTFIPFIFSYYYIEYFIIVLFLVNIPLIYFLKEVFSKNFITKLPKLSLSLKLIMIFGLFAIYFGAV